MIHLEEVSPDNWRLDLHVRNDQKDFAANSITLLARAYAYRNSGSRALIIYNEDIPIGMALYYYIDGAYDFSQFFIDERYQGNGFGYEATGHVLREMQKDGVYNRVVLCYIEGNEAAKQLYLKLGFNHTGETDGNEIIMEKKLR